MCSRATIASSTWNKYQLIDNFYSLLAASICCHRGRYRCDTAIHACTRGLSLNEKNWIPTQQAGRPGSSEVPRNPLTRWDVSSIPANGIFLTKKLKNKIKMPNGWRTIKSLVHKIRLHSRRKKNSRSTPVAQLAPRNLLTRWDVSSIPANGIFLTKN